MSLLADLLSKIKPNTSHGGEDGSPQLDVPPTLSKTQKNPAKVAAFRSRYIAISGLALALIAAGALLTARLGTQDPATAPATPAPPQAASPPAPPSQPAPPAPPVPAPAAGPQAGEAPAPATPPTLQSNSARIALGDGPAGGSKGAGRADCPTCPPAPRARPQARAARPPVPAPRPLLQAPRAPAPSAAAQREAAAPAKSSDLAARDSFLYAARSAEQAGDWKAALASYRRAQELDPGNYRIMSNTAAALNNLGLYEEGGREAERALRLKPDYLPALVNAAIGHSSTGNAPRARRLFNSALALDPGNRSVTLNLGILDERSGNLDEALATYRQLANAGDPAALEGMARVYERKGKKLEAMRSYRQILAQPNTSAALRKQVKGRLARLEE